MADQSNTIAQLLTQSQGGVFDPAQLQQSVKLGMDLATAKDKIESQKIELQQQKDAVEQKKFDLMHNGLMTLTRTSPSIAKRVVPQLMKRFDAAGLAYDPLVLEQIASDDNIRNKIKQLDSGGAFEGMRGDPQQRQEAFTALADVVGFDKALEYTSGMTKQKMAQDSAERTADRAAQKTADTQSKEIRTALTSAKRSFDTNTKKERERVDATLDAETLLKSPGAISAEVAKRRLARLAGETGVLTDSDINAFAGSRALLDRANQLLNTAYSGKLTEKNKQEMLSIIQTMRQNITKNLQAEADRQIESTSGIYGIPRERVQSAIQWNAKEPAAAKDNKQQAAEAVIKNSKYPPEKIAEMMAAKGLNYTVEQINAIRGK